MTTYNKLIVLRFNPSIPLLRNIDKWDIQKGIEITKITEGAYGFKFQERQRDIERTENVVFTIYINIQKESGIHYINGYLETADDIRARLEINTERWPEHNRTNHQKEDIMRDEALLRRMELHNWDTLVRGINCSWSEPFLYNDVLIEN